MKKYNIQFFLILKQLNLEFIRYIICGLLNAALSYIIYVLLNLIINYQISYFITYITGIVISFYLNSKYTFFEKITMPKLLQFSALYLFYYFFSAFLLWFFIEQYHFSKYITPLAVAGISMPVIFLMNRLVIKR